MNTGLFSIILLAIGIILSGCATYDRSQGVANTWRDPAVPAPVTGQTTQSDIIEALGPPSQVIGLRDQTVFYYLRERRKGKGAILILYNWVNENVTYDRAIFFFDKNGVLQDYGYSNEAIVAEP
jgi:outer membrane protein assembly factor BamE (lipoprotein component of BamABCDE complex)